MRTANARAHAITVLQCICVYVFVKSLDPFQAPQQLFRSRHEISSDSAKTRWSFFCDRQARLSDYGEDACSHTSAGAAHAARWDLSCNCYWIPGAEYLYCRSLPRPVIPALCATLSSSLKIISWSIDPSP